MQSRLINHDQAKTFSIIFGTGDNLMAGLLGFAREYGLTASHFTGIGALSQVRLSYFDWQTKEYQEIPPIDEQVEVLTLAGGVALNDGEPFVHAHIVVGKSDGRAYGGHLVEASVRPTAEVVLIESPSYLQRRFDPESGLPLISL